MQSSSLTLVAGGRTCSSTWTSTLHATLIYFMTHFKASRQVNVHILDGNAPNLAEECHAYEAAIKAHGGVELFLCGASRPRQRMHALIPSTGIGPDGHIAFNGVATPRQHVMCHGVYLGRTWLVAAVPHARQDAGIRHHAGKRFTSHTPRLVCRNCRQLASSATISRRCRAWHSRLACRRSWSVDT